MAIDQQIKADRPEGALMKFHSAMTTDHDLSQFGQETIKNEPMLFNCSVDHACNVGGPITRAFLQAMPDEFFPHAVIDSRVHMLMPGWYPCIPGWHHDDVPRDTPTSQPNYETPAYFARHCMALVGGDIAPTEFLTGDIEVPEPTPTGPTYGQWDIHLESNGRAQGQRLYAPDRRIILFDAATFHRGTPARGTGWRWFCRATINTDRKPTNEIRRQVQVYMSAVNAGW